MLPELWGRRRILRRRPRVTLASAHSGQTSFRRNYYPPIEMSKKRVIASKALKDGERVTLGMNVLLWKEAGIHYAFSPSLDITGYGKTEVEARRSFEVMLDEFLEYTHNKGTIFKELERLGWTVNKKKKRVKAPEHHELLADNEDYREIVNRPGLKNVQREVALAL